MTQSQCGEEGTSANGALADANPGICTVFEPRASIEDDATVFAVTAAERRHDTSPSTVASWRQRRDGRARRQELGSGKVCAIAARVADRNLAFVVRDRP